MFSGPIFSVEVYSLQDPAAGDPVATAVHLTLTGHHTNGVVCDDIVQCLAQGQQVGRGTDSLEPRGQLRAAGVLPGDP